MLLCQVKQNIHNLRSNQQKIKDIALYCQNEFRTNAHVKPVISTTQNYLRDSVQAIADNVTSLGGQFTEILNWQQQQLDSMNLTISSSASVGYRVVCVLLTRLCSNGCASALFSVFAKCNATWRCSTTTPCSSHGPQGLWESVDTKQEFWKVRMVELVTA